jgi:hypothetical protein
MNEPDERTGVSPRAVSTTASGFDEEEPPGKPRRHPIWRAVPAKQWNDWRWQSKNAIRSLRQLRNLPTFSPDELVALGEPEGRHKLAIPPSCFSLINLDGPNNPVRPPSVTAPVESECPFGYELEAPLEARQGSRVPGLTHRCADRLRFVPTRTCIWYRRFCTRKRAPRVRGGWDTIRTIRAFGRNEKMGLFSGISVIISERSKERMRIVPTCGKPSLLPRLNKGGIFFMFVTTRRDHSTSYRVIPLMACARFEVRERIRDGHKSLHARRAFAPGDVLERIAARKTLREPAVHSVQLNESEHILLEPQFLEYTNHSCSPNVVFDLDEMVVRAIERILPGDEIVYFYPSTERSMAQPFLCDCGSDNCLGVIRGADYLPTEVLDRYHLATHIRSLLS